VSCLKSIIPSVIVFQTAQTGDIVIAELNSKTITGFHFDLLCMDGGKGFFLEDLSLTAFCPIAQVIPAIDPRNPNKIFAPGDLVRCEILKLTPSLEKVVVGMKGNTLSPEMRHSVQLGLIFQPDLPLQFSYVKEIKAILMF